MSRIRKLFEKKNKNILSVYFTAGFPTLNSTLTVMKSLQDAGADMIELGIPYSDPLADGPVIQSSGTMALANGMTITHLFKQLRNFRNEIGLPVLFMGYMNPIMQYGFENFCRDAAEVGVDGLILPDLPMFEFKKEFGTIVSKYNLDFVFLVTPETDEIRLRKLDQLSSGFIYAVSSSSTTGKVAALNEQEKYFERLQRLKLQNPVLIGFGIRDRSSFLKACTYANGAIIGTAYIKVLENAGDQEIPARTMEFINSLK
ncbi:MAG TPA: tryptophan synthase subunit alpha [Puia sp.]|nr:tryptophan synthase subunit alpha [Puia sp.]